MFCFIHKELIKLDKIWKNFGCFSCLIELLPIPRKPFLRKITSKIKVIRRNLKFLLRRYFRNWQLEAQAVTITSSCNRYTSHKCWRFSVNSINLLSVKKSKIQKWKSFYGLHLAFGLCRPLWFSNFTRRAYTCGRIFRKMWNDVMTL